MKLNDFVSVDVHQTNNNNYVFNLGDEHIKLYKYLLCKDCKTSLNCYDSIKFIELMKKYAKKNNLSFDLFMELPYFSIKENKDTGHRLDYDFKKILYDIKKKKGIK